MSTDSSKYNNVDQSQYEVAREDGRGKFITLADRTNFPDWYQYMFHTPVKERTGEGKVKSPYNNVTISLIVYQEPKASFTKYIEVDEFLLLCDKVKKINRVSDKVTVAKLIGFSERSKMATSLDIIAQPALKDPDKVSFMLSFAKGPASPNDSGVGFKWGADKQSNFIAIDQDAMKRFCISGEQHLLAARTAALTRFYESLYVKKNF
jgi:hypothetical protein